MSSSVYCAYCPAAHAAPTLTEARQHARIHGWVGAYGEQPRCPNCAPLKPRRTAADVLRTLVNRRTLPAAQQPIAAAMLEEWTS